MKLSNKAEKLIKEFKDLAAASAYDNERVGGEEAEETDKEYQKTEQNLRKYIFELEKKQ